VQGAGWEHGTDCSTLMFFSTLSVVLESSNLKGTGVTTQLDIAGN
jgi:hypothetical protein